MSAPDADQQHQLESIKIDSSAILEASKEVNDFWRAKVKFYFNEILDFDSDGHVSSKDVEAFKGMYKYIKSLDHDSPELERFSRFLNRWIDSILTLTNQNHVTTKTPMETTISLADFMIYCESIRCDLVGRQTWPQSLHYMSDYIDALFNILDTNNDGYISRDDFLSNYASQDDYKNRLDSWEILSNKDPELKIDKKRFDELCIQFLVSTNPDDPGNWIFGMFAY